MDTIQKITEEKDYSSRVEKTSQDELGALIDHFNEMLIEIEQRDRKLAQHRAELEDTVETRTAELRRSNEDLANAVRQAEEAKDAAERANRAKSQFLANMSHEIRTPMHGVIGNTDLMLRTKLSDRQRRLAETVHHSGGVLLGLINDILDFSKIEAGKLKLDVAEFDLWETLEDVIDLFNETASNKGVRLNRLFPGDCPRIVRGDSMRLRQVLSNLLSNAIKFTPEGDVTFRIETMDKAKGTVGLRFEIQDSGIGIGADARQRIFSAFAQADESTTRRFGGTGLGLAICKQLVELMGGDIGVDSEVGKGSTFWFTATLERSATSESGLVLASKAADSLRTLVADPDGDNRAHLVRFLTAWGLQVDEASDPDQTIEKLAAAETRGAPYGLAILDSSLLGRDLGTTGPTAGRDHPHIGPTVIVMSDGIETRDSRDPAFGSRTISVTKPVHQSQLYDAVVSVLHRAPSSREQQPERPEQAPDTPPYTGARVLVAEDNPVNQALARDSLELLGCQVDIVPDGVQAVAAAGRSHYDIVFMDCHMPNLDGFEATQRIRADERERGSHTRACVIALTASAMNEDRERCLAVGMDDHLSKPFTQGQLLAKMEQWFAPGSTGTADPEDAVPSAVIKDAVPSAVTDPESGDSPDDGPLIDQTVIDNIRALQRDGRPDVLGGVIAIYMDSSRQLVDDVRKAVADNDSAAIRRTAHALKSSSANLGGRHLATLCQDLENLGRDNTIQGAGDLAVRIGTAHAALCDALEALRTETAA